VWEKTASKATEMQWNMGTRTQSQLFPIFPHFPTISLPFPICTFQFWFLFLHGIDMAKVVGLPLFRGLGFEQL